MSSIAELKEELRAARNQTADVAAPVVDVEVDHTADLKTQRKQLRRRKRAEARQRTHLHLQHMLLVRLDAALAALEIVELLVSSDVDMFGAQAIDDQLAQIQKWRSFNLGWFDPRTLDRKIKDTVYTFGPYVTYRFGADKEVSNFYLGHVESSFAGSDTLGLWHWLINKFIPLQIPTNMFWKSYIQLQNRLDEQAESK